MSHSVIILEVVRVVPPPSKSVTLPLSFFDLNFLEFRPVECLLFYKVPELTTPSSSLVPKLKSSLSATLLHYLPLAGRLLWDTHTKPTVVYSRDENDAVCVTVAESNGDISRLAGDQPRCATEYHSLVPMLQSSDESVQILAVQITVFPNQGFCLGVTMHHGVVDGKSIAKFLNAWDHICKHEQEDVSLPHDLIPFMDRTVIQDPTDIYTKLLNHKLSACNNKPSLKLPPPKEIGPDVVRVTHRLTPDNIQKLRELVLKTKLSSSQLRLSTFVISYAYIITCKVKAHGGDSTRLFGAGLSSDFRARLNPPLPSTYFGNCLVGMGSENKAETILVGEGKGFVSAVEIVNGWVNVLCPEMVGMSMCMPLKASKKIEPAGKQMIFSSGSTRFGLYESDFGWGKPVKIEMVTIDKNGAVAFSESGDGTGGVEIGVCLKEHEVERFGSLFSNGLL